MIPFGERCYSNQYGIISDDEISGFANTTKFRTTKFRTTKFRTTKFLTTKVLATEVLATKVPPPWFHILKNVSAFAYWNFIANVVATNRDNFGKIFESCFPKVAVTKVKVSAVLWRKKLVLARIGNISYKIHQLKT